MTLYTSGIDPARKNVLKNAALSLGFAVFCAVFGAIYEHFSFGVYSYYMLYAFAAPLLTGFLLMLTAIGSHLPSERTVFLMHIVSATLAVGSIAAGIIRIYGTDNKLLRVYIVTAGILALFAAMSYSEDYRQPSIHQTESV